MEEQTLNQAPSEGRDFRIIAVIVLRKLVGYSIFLFFLFAFLTYREDINMVNLYRIMSYIDTDVKELKGFNDYRFEIGLENVYEPFNGGLAVLNRDTFKLINSAGMEDLSVQLKYLNPHLCVTSSRVLAYDKGAKSYSIFGTYALLKRVDTDYVIQKAIMNQNGDYILICDQSGYRSAVKVFSDSAKEKYSWSTSEYYVTSGCINGNGSEFALLCFGGSNGQAFSKVRVSSPTSQTPLYEIDLGNRVVYSMNYDLENNLILTTDEGVFTYDSKGALISSFPYSIGSLLGYYHEDGENPIIAYSPSDEAAVKIATLKGGSEIDAFTVFGNIRNISTAFDKTCVLTGENLFVRDNIEKSLTEHSIYGAKSAVPRADGSVLVIYNDRADLLTTAEK